MRRLAVLFAALAAFWADAAPVSGNTSDLPRSGMFLVARPDLPDPRFARSVVLILQHDADGTVGLIVNHPSKVNPSHIFPELEDFTDLPDLLYFGGPVSPATLSVLLRSHRAPDGGRHVFGDTYLLGLGDFLIYLVQGKPEDDDLKVYFGYAGWDGGQLQKELDRGDWRIHAADGKTIFEKNPEEAWQDLRRHLPPLIVQFMAAPAQDQLLEVSR